MSALPWKDPARVAALEAALARRILVIDGAMGTMLQTYKLDEDGYRGERFARDHAGTHAHGHGPACDHDVKGNNDLLTLTQPHIIRGVHDGLSRRRRGHDRNQHVQLHLDQPGRLPAGTPRPTN